MEALNVLLLVFILVCAVAVSVTKDLLTSIIIFMAQRLLMFVTLKKLHAIHIQGKKGEDEDE